MQEQVKREASKQGGFSLLFVLVAGLLSIILGYLGKK
jgi:Tfp pilus assembly protein PilV